MTIASKSGAPKSARVSIRASDGTACNATMLSSLSGDEPVRTL
jgi:hypothetical protein